MARYKGFSTVGRFFKFRVTDYELAKQDLINHLQMSKGEKLMNPDFGTIIWELLFENRTQDLRNEIIAEMERVVSYDPRLQLISVDFVEYEFGIMIDLEVLYTGDAKPVTLRLEFERDTATVREI